MDLELDHKSSTPLHQQAEELLRSMIRQEEYKKGKLLPNEVVLSKQLNIARNTLRQAINKLVNEGLLIRKKGVGTRVSPMNVMGNGRNWMSFTQEMKTLGFEAKNFELHISKKNAPAEVCQFFNIKKGERLHCIERLRGRQDLPFVYFVSYFNPSIKLSGDENMSRPLYDILREDHNIFVKTSKEMIYAQPAEAHIAEKIDVNEGDPLLVRKRFVLDAKGVPIEYNIGYYRADSFTYSIEFINE